MVMAKRSFVNSILAKVHLRPFTALNLEEEPPAVYFQLIVFYAISGVCTATNPVASTSKACSGVLSSEEQLTSVNVLKSITE